MMLELAVAIFIGSMVCVAGRIMYLVNSLYKALAVLEE